MGKARSPVPGHRARKRFGQNFLHDSSVIDRIVQSVNPQPTDQVVEIGPGKGAITGGLVASGAQLQAIELDRDLVPWLNLQFGLEPNFSLLSQDAMTVDFAELAPTGQRLRVVGNLPYNISTPLIFHLLEYRQAIQDMHFMLQQEVVERMAAGPGSKTYGKLSVMVQYHCSVLPLFSVPPGSFNPAPKVNSAVVRLRVHQQLPFPASSLATLEAVVSAAFGQRRKTLRNALSKHADEQQLADAGISSKMRAEEVSLEHYVALSNILSQGGASKV
jgi:16S rRNA (adenine1518-N6/adenine1519-N6)-dimethyltransferase